MAASWSEIGWWGCDDHQEAKQHYGRGVIKTSQEARWSTIWEWPLQGGVQDVLWLLHCWSARRFPNIGSVRKANPTKLTIVSPDVQCCHVIWICEISWQNVELAFHSHLHCQTGSGCEWYENVHVLQSRLNDTKWYGAHKCACCTRQMLLCIKSGKLKRNYKPGSC